LQAQKEDEHEREQRGDADVDEDVFDDLELESVGRDVKHDDDGVDARHGDDDDDDVERFTEDVDEDDIKKFRAQKNAAMRGKVPEKPTSFKVIGAKTV
jgi:hypothetical protein